MTRPHSGDRFSVISLFTGAGGLDIGLESVERYKLLAAVEYEPSFCETLKINRDAGRFGSFETKIIESDISKLDPAVFMRTLGIQPGELDLLIGGPPCQSWSTAGRRGTAKDPRGQLLWHFLKFVEVLKPKVFLMENVRGLLSAALRHRPIAQRPDKGGAPLDVDEMPGSAIKTWIEDLSHITNGAYRVDSFEVNAVNYGAPQIRERVLFIGNRMNGEAVFPQPTHGQKTDSLLPFSTLTDALAGFQESDPILLDFSPRKKFYLRHVPEGGNWRALSPEMAEESMGRAYFAKGGRSGWWRRLSWDLPCPTVTTLPNHSSTSMCHPSETRVLSVGEFAAVQEFPSNWQFAGTPQEQMKQVGNAVPTRLGRIAGDVIAEILDIGERSPIRELPLHRNHYIKSHVRTRSWWKDGSAVVRGATPHLVDV